MALLPVLDKDEYELGPLSFYIIANDIIPFERFLLGHCKLPDH